MSKAPRHPPKRHETWEGGNESQHPIYPYFPPMIFHPESPLAPPALSSSQNARFPLVHHVLSIGSVSTLFCVTVRSNADICAYLCTMWVTLFLLVWSYWQDLLLLIYHAFLDSFSDVHWCTCEMLRDAKTSRSSVSWLPFGFHIRLSLRILTPIPTHSERAPRATSNELVDLSPKTRQIIFCTEWKAPKAPRKASQSLLLSYLQWRTRFDVNATEKRMATGMEMMEMMEMTSRPQMVLWCAT